MVNGFLPDGWAWTTVEELSKNIQYGYTESAKDESVGPKFLRITDIQNGKVDWATVPYCECSDEEVNKYLLESGDIVFARTGATTGKSFLITNPPRAVFASYLIRLRLQEAVNRKYFSYFLDSPDYWSQIMQVRKGSAQPGVNATILAKLQVPVAPLPEQERIVAKIEELFTQLEAGTAALERVQAGLKRYKASVLKAAVSGRLVNGNLEIGDDELPAGWKWVTLGEITQHLTSGSRGWAKYYSEEGSLFVRVGNFNRLSNTIDLTKLQLVNAPDTAEANRTRLKKRDLLITMTADVGMVGIVDERTLRWGDAYINQHVGLVRLGNPDYVDYVSWALASEIGQKQFREKQYGLTKVGLNFDDIRSLEIPLPPLEEQRRIVAEVERRLSLAAEVESTLEESLSRAGRLRQSVLKSAFEGRLV
ncbi:MAG: restriction endonuclease subunit S [Anaerolineales bacterium]|nr:restriction endonuclease subunit S [Anaerolineales bacterium]